MFENYKKLNGDDENQEIFIVAIFGILADQDNYF